MHLLCRRLVASIALATFAVGGCSASDGSGDSSSTLEPLEDVPPAVRPIEEREPGTIIEATEIAPPQGARSWRVDYHSVDVRGEPTAGRATVTIPMTTPPQGGFPVVLYGHPTTGTADSCAPSLEGPTAIPFVAKFIDAGFAVVAADYEGLAAPGPHPYLVGSSEGRSMLDAGKAAQGVKGAGIEPTSPVALWGFSQGGHAALFAAEMAAEVAPVLDVRGVAVAAPVTDVASFVERSEDWPAQFGILTTVINAYQYAYDDVDAGAVLSEEVIDELDLMESLCIAEINAHFDREIAPMLVASPLDVDAVARRLAENLPGTRPLGMPTLVVQGAQDDIIDPADTQALVNRLCANGDATSYLIRPGENHAVHVDDLLLPWLQGRFTAGEPPDNCLEAVSD